MQLFFVGDTNKAYQTLRSQLNKDIVFTGKLMHASTGHYHSNVLLDDSVCHALAQ